MLSPYDDLPVHQTADPVAHPATSDPNAYDRYFFHGYDAAGELFFGAALGLYPNREVIDASFSVQRGGVQRSVHASGRLARGARPTAIGPIRVEVVEPLHTLRVVVDDPAGDLGVAADLTFTARTVAMEEPRHTLRNGGTVLLDATRLTQFGDWDGTITVDGATLTVEAARHHGTRDRSWGVRPMGTGAGGAPSHELPQVFWLWAPLRLGDRVLHAGLHEAADGRRLVQSTGATPVVDGARLHPATGDHPLVDLGRLVEPMRDVQVAIDWAAGTRRAAGATLTFEPWHGEPTVVDLQPRLCFPMRGLGYVSPDWPHGAWHGELVVGTESLVVADLDPLDVHHLHVQQVCTATIRSGPGAGTVGEGVLELLALGPHAPTGLTGFLEYDGPASTPDAVAGTSYSLHPGR